MSAKPDTAAAQQLGLGLLDQMSRQFPDMNDIFWLVRNGASLSVRDRDGLTPLVRAMGMGNKPLIREMVRHGAGVNDACGKHRVTALQIAASSGDLELVQLMVDAGGDVLQKNAIGVSALDGARRNPNGDVLPFVESVARPGLAAAASAEQHELAIKAGLPVEKPFRPLKRITLRPR